MVCHLCVIVCIVYYSYNDTVTKLLTIGESFLFPLNKDTNYPIIKIRRTVLEYSIRSRMQNQQVFEHFFHFQKKHSGFAKLDHMGYNKSRKYTIFLGRNSNQIMWLLLLRGIHLVSLLPSKRK